MRKVDFEEASPERSQESLERTLNSRILSVPEIHKNNQDVIQKNQTTQNLLTALSKFDERGKLSLNQLLNSLGLRKDW
jgi:hypothetical protein